MLKRYLNKSVHQLLKIQVNLNLYTVYLHVCTVLTQSSKKKKSKLRTHLSTSGPNNVP